MKDKELLKMALTFIADLNGSDWIKGIGAGEVDMRQRAKALQRALSDSIYRPADHNTE